MMDFAGTKTENKQAAVASTPRRAALADDMSLAGITVVISLAGLMGLWGLACLLAGLAKGDGIFACAVAWISAVFGF